MATTARTIFEITHHLGLVPLAWLTSLWSAGIRPAAAWWGLAAAFAVSWVADWAAHRFGGFPVGPLYLLFQAGIIAAILAPTWVALRFIAVLAATSGFAMLTLDLQQPDVLVHVVAWVGLLAILWPQRLIYPVRLMLWVAFWLGGFAWLGYVVRPGWVTWGIYQGLRATSIGLFCWASWRPHPLLRPG